MSVNEKLLSLIKARQQKKTEFGYGILTADKYVRTIRECVGVEACYKYASAQRTSFQDVMDKAGKTLVYGNPDMEMSNAITREIAEAPNGNDWPKAMQGAVQYWTRHDCEKEIDGATIDIPDKALMVFKHVLTTPRKDRDGDILRTEGAEVDPKMNLLWQHVHTLPIGKMLAVAEHNSNKLSLISVIVDMNQLCHDAAVMVESGMGRFSHGFRALQFDTLKEDEGDTTGPAGFDITKFEIMEASLVSVPSNVDAETEEIILDLVEGEKLKSGLMKEVGKGIRSRRDKRVTVPDQIEEIDDENKSGGGDPEGEGTKEGCTCSPKEADGETKEEGQTRNPEVMVKFHGRLENSWEWIEDKLRSKAKSFLSSQSVGIGERDWTYIVGTFPDHSVVCVEKPEAGVTDEFRYFKVEWSIVNDEPEFKGTPTQVDIVTTTELRERSPAFKTKNEPEDEKAGRTLSARNLQTLKDVKDDLEEMSSSESLSRGGGALCDRCITKLGTVIDRAGGGDAEETSTQEIDVKTALQIVVAKANADQRDWLSKLLQLESKLSNDRELAKQFGTITSV